jgi:hypothetical protein
MLTPPPPHPLPFLSDCSGDTLASFRTLLEMECPCYLQESGIHTGCHLSNLSLLSVKSYVLVNGSSPAMGIQFFDSIFLTKGIGENENY